MHIEEQEPLDARSYAGRINLSNRADVHKIPARVQCTVQVCELALSNLHPPPAIA
jgi:hypothetical protein